MEWLYFVMGQVSSVARTGTVLGGEGEPPRQCWQSKGMEQSAV